MARRQMSMKTAVEEAEEILNTPLVDPEVAGKLKTISLRHIELGENSRDTDNPQALAELMVSMKQSGLLQPVGVRELGRNRYELIFGNRRFAAATKLGWKRIDALILENDEDENALLINAVENLQRLNVAPAEQGRIFSVLVEGGMTSEQIAARIGISARSVRSYVQLYRRLPKEYRSKVVAKQNGRGLEKGNGIAASMVFSLLRAGEKLNLTTRQRKELLDWASTRPVNHQLLRVISAQMSGGATLEEALESAQNARTITLIIVVDKAKSYALERRTGVCYNELLVRELNKNKNLGLLRAPTTFRRQPSPKGDVNACAGAEMDTE